MRGPRVWIVLGLRIRLRKAFAGTRAKPLQTTRTPLVSDQPGGRRRVRDRRGARGASALPNPLQRAPIGNGSYGRQCGVCAVSRRSGKKSEPTH